MSKVEIEKFLADLKIAIATHGLDVVPRRPNNEALIDLGLTPSIREQIVLNLDYRDYSEGSLPDD